MTISRREMPVESVDQRLEFFGTPLPIKHVSVLNAGIGIIG